MLFFPISCSICNYINTIENKISGKKYSKESEAYASVVVIVIWICVGFNLYK